MSNKTIQPDPNAPVKATYLINVRFHLVKKGAFPYDSQVPLYGFDTFKLTEGKLGGGITEKQALALAKKRGAKEDGLTIESVSLLPPKW